MKNILFCLVITLCFTFCSFSCNAKEKPILIALSKASGSESYLRYAEWISSFGQDIQTVDLFALPIQTAIDTLAYCQGIIFTGGADYHPGRYGMAADSSVCDIEPDRDTLDYALMDKATQLGLPILGICRGEQLINIYSGGTLDPDIHYVPNSPKIHQCKGEPTCDHAIRAEKNSFLFSICQTDTGTVNSNHHQAVARSGNGLRIVASSPDGIVEAIERIDPHSQPFLLGVEWHPERLDVSNPFGGKIGMAFIQAAKSFGRKVK